MSKKRKEITIAIKIWAEEDTCHNCIFKGFNLKHGDICNWLNKKLEVSGWSYFRLPECKEAEIK